MHCQVTSFWTKSNFIWIRIVVNEVLLAKEHFEYTLLVRAWNNSQATIPFYRIAQVNAYVQHRHYFFEVKKISEAVCVPSKFGELAVLGIDIMIQDHSIFFIFSNSWITAFSEQSKQSFEAGVKQKFMQHRAK